MSIAVWLSFCAACVVFSIAPGAGAISTMSQSLAHGVRRAGFNILGLQLALLTHIAIVALGLGAVIASSVWAFGILKYLGAAYLVYLGLAKWWTASPSAAGSPEAIAVGSDASKTPAVSSAKLVFSGFLVNLSNPKSIVFLVAFFPQFLHPDQPLLPQYLVLAATLIAIDCLVMSSYALLAGKAKQLVATPARVQLQNKIFGTLFIATGLTLARAEH